MNTVVLLLRTLKNDPKMTQRKLAENLNVSLGKINQTMKENMEEGYIFQTSSGYHLTEKGEAYLEKYRVGNAIIIAAGFGSRFVPLTYEMPKGLLKVFGERMIERQIRQLQEMGITDITIIVGYLKEKFEYLMDQYGVKLIYNPEYAVKNTLATLYYGRHLLKNTYVLSSDNWMRENIFHRYEPDAWYSAVYMHGKTSEWCLNADKRGRITSVQVGGENSYVMYGPVYFNEAFSEKFIPLLERYYHQPGTESFYWEDVYLRNINQLTLYQNSQREDMVYEFENLEELRLFDEKYQNHSENEVLEKIAEIFEVSESEITGIRCLKAGMTNKSFLFHVRDQGYIFRIPGAGTQMLIDRHQEKEAYEAVAELHLSDAIIYFDGENGYKISKYYEGCHNCDAQNTEEVTKCMKILRSFHKSGMKVNHDFDLLERIQFYEGLCVQNRGIQFEDYILTKKKMEKLFSLLEGMERPQVLSHIDSVEANFLFLENGEIRLIDWEYAGMCDPLIDPAMFAIYSYYTEEQADWLLRTYFEREPEPVEWIRFYSYIALGGFLWALWAEYKSALGDEFGEYTIKMYRYSKTYYKKVRKILGEESIQHT